MDGKEAALEFINKNFPDCYAAMLTGSVARNEQRANNRSWTGERKRLYRALKRLDNELSRQLIEGLENYYRKGEKEKLINSVLTVLNLVGGKLYEGFSA